MASHGYQVQKAVLYKDRFLDAKPTHIVEALLQHVGGVGVVDVLFESVLWWNAAGAIVGADQNADSHHDVEHKKYRKCCG